MNDQSFAAQLAKAWQLHQSGDQDAAIREFNTILAQSAEHIDAFYGRGLSELRAGKIGDARASFKQALVLTEAQLAKNPKVDRYQMLVRMIQQRLDYLPAASE